MTSATLDPAYAQEIADTGGFVHEMKHHVAGFVPRSKKLLVCFGGIGEATQDTPRRPWADPIARRLGWSNLANFPQRTDWYRHSGMFQFYRRLSREGFFDQFEDVVFYGTSMGGYAAAAFSAAAPGSRVVAMAPQSTLHGRRVGFERRFAHGVKLGKWDAGPWKDAATSVKLARRVDLFFDPYQVSDAKHAKRLMGPQTSVYPVICGGHACARSLRDYGLLSQIARKAVEGTLTPSEFHKMHRARLGIAGHHERVLRRAFKRGRYGLVVPRLQALAQRTGHPRWAELHGAVSAHMEGRQAFSWPVNRGPFMASRV